MTARPLRWGVVGARATIARLAVLPALAASPTATLVSLASRGTEGEIAEIARQFGAQRCRSGARAYDDLLEDPDVEAVYIPLPNGLHRAWTLRALGRGKHVLCEKPLAMSPGEARVMVEAAASSGLVLGEAYMTAHHPRHQHLVEQVRSGLVGSVLSIRAAFTFPHEVPEDHRWDPVLGGGALADVGIYCLAAVLALAPAPPRAVAAWQRRGGPGRAVDSSFAAWLDLVDATASVECSFEAPERQVLQVTGTQGAVRVEQAYTAGEAEDRFVLHRRDGSQEVIVTGGTDPYRAMVEDFALAVRGVRPLRWTTDDTLAVADLEDRLRRAAEAAA